MFLCKSSKGYRFLGKDEDVKTFPVESITTNEDTEDIFAFRNISDNKIAIRAEKRFNKHFKHPCGCHYKEKRIDFGVESYPRYHMAKYCDTEKIKSSENHCSFGSECKEHFMNILLLKYKPNNNDDEVRDLPLGIREDYYWERKTISIDCRCAFK
jgi:hypothetical protein